MTAVGLLRRIFTMDPPAAKKARKGDITVDCGQHRTGRRRQGGPMLCDCCDVSITSGDDHVQNDPCGHNVCLLCVVKSNMSRGSNPACCQVGHCQQNKYTTMCTYYRRGSPQEVIKNKEIGFDEFEKRYLPMKCLQDNHLAEMKEESTMKDSYAAVIFIGTIRKDKDGGIMAKSYANTFLMKKTEDGYDYADDTIDKIRSSFARMHPILIPPSKPPESRDNPVLTAREYLEQRILYPPLILHALYGLSTGIVNFDTVKQKLWTAGDDPSYQNQFLAAAGAADMLMRSSANKPNSFQLMLGQYFNRFKLSKEVLSLFSALQLAPSQNFSVAKRSKSVMEKLQRGLKIAPRDLVFILSDNIGFRVLGLMAGYDQYTLTNVM